jgi:hypothetical protein
VEEEREKGREGREKQIEMEKKTTSKRRIQRGREEDTEEEKILSSNSVSQGPLCSE